MYNQSKKIFYLCLLILSLFFEKISLAQTKFLETDSTFQVRVCDYYSLNSMDVKDTSFKIHPKYPDIALSYDYENRLYENTPFSLVCKNGKDEWMTIYYFDRYTELDSILKIDFDKKGKPEIVLYYREFIQATGASTGKSGIIIINIDDTPKELCHVVSYAEENLSHYNQVGGKSEFNKCSRKVSVSSKGVQISRNSTKNKLSECTNVPEGLYVLTNEGFKKQK